jgi:hypothetical protein
MAKRFFTPGRPFRSLPRSRGSASCGQERADPAGETAQVLLGGDGQYDGDRLHQSKHRSREQVMSALKQGRCFVSVSFLDEDRRQR